MEHLIFVCPSTGRAVDSGVESEIGTLLRIRQQSVRVLCPACGRLAPMGGAGRLPGKNRRRCSGRRSSHRLTHATDAPRHGAHDVKREVRYFIDHEPEFALIDE